MSDTVDISMDAVVEQYRDEIAKQIGDKILLQAALKIIGEQKTELLQQVAQLAQDLESAADTCARLSDRVDFLERQLDEQSLPLKPVPVNPNRTAQFNPSGHIKDGAE